MSVGGRTVTVFGGSGFIGRYLIQRLARAGMVVRVPSRHVSRIGHLRTAGVVGQIVPEIVDVYDDTELRAAIEGSDIVVNLIGILSETRANSFQRVHAELPGRIARAAAAAGVQRLVHISALGASPDSSAVYAKTKYAGEEAVRAAFPAATIVRPSIVFGPEDRFFNKFATLVQISPVLPLIGGGKTRFQPVYVGDVADAIAAAVSKPEAAGRLYELVGPQTYDFRQLMEMILAETGRERLLVPVSFDMARFKASLIEWIPNAPLTQDQVELLKTDNVASGGVPGLRDLGVSPTAVEVILPTYMERFRRGGRFAESSRA